MRKAHAYGFENIFENSDLKFLKTSVKFLSDEIAVVHTRMRLKDQTPIKENEAPSLRHNFFSFVVKKEDDKWLCESTHNTDMIPGAETNLKDDKSNLRSVNYRDRQA
ncbi:hypothetical protein ACKGJO_12440 [Gracilimonas sp. Q87]|uniref:hypothetical protein n=1 Tax=Gracilimonas sp. Q87 TaxID=3384766 RepID=UPI0039841F68